MAKRNTFTDTIAAAEHLVALEWTTPDVMTLEGRSAGGMTVGAVTNMRPDLFQVPFPLFSLFVSVLFLHAMRPDLFQLPLPIFLLSIFPCHAPRPLPGAAPS